METKNSLNKIRRIFIFFMYFILTFSAVEEFNSLKYISIIGILMLIIVDVLKNKAVKKNVIIFGAVIFIQAIAMCFQKINISQIFTTLLYYVVLLMISISGYRLIKQKDDLKVIFYAVFIATIIIMGMSKGEIIYQYNILSKYINRVRIYGKFNHVNTLGYLSSVLLIVSFILGKDLNSKKFLRISIIFINFAFLMIASSRGAIYSVVIFFCLYYLPKIIKGLPVNNSIKQLILIFIYMLIIVGSCIFVIDVVFNTDTYMSRIEVLDEIKGDFYQTIAGRGMLQASDMDFSNITGYLEIAWINIFYRSGLIGVSAFLIIFINLWKNISKIENTEKKHIAKCLFIAILATTFVESIIVNIFNLVPLFLWPVISTCANYKNKIGEKNEIESKQ